MNQFKRTQVVMLPTEDRCFIFMNKNKTWLKSSNVILDDHPVERNQHLYIISDDEIKEGDWCYCSKENRCIKNEMHTNVPSTRKKIIATTDSSLNKKHDCDCGATTYEGCSQCLEILPQPSQQFIEKYIESYNKGEIITDVLLEYEKNVEMRQGYPKPSTANGKTEWNYDKITSYNLKVNPKDNTITIKKLKDSWNREELIEKLKSILYDSSSLVYTLPDNTVESIDYELFNNWIKDNL